MQAQAVTVYLVHTMMWFDTGLVFLGLVMVCATAIYCARRLSR